MEITTQLKTWCVIMLILGQGLQIVLFKIPSLKKQARIANKQFTIKEWWGEDWNAMVATLIIGAMLTIGINEVVAWKPYLLSFLKWLYGLVGFCGSYAVLSVASTYQKKLMALLDVKVNLADQMTGGTSTVSETISAAKDQLNIDVAPTPKKPS